MFRSTWRLSVVALAVAAVALWALAGVNASAVPSYAEQAARPAQGSEGPIPCDPVVTRRVSKQVVKAGEEFSVQVEYYYKCTNTKRRVNFIILVENTPYLRGGDPTEKPLVDGAAAPEVGGMLNSVKNGLKQFVNDVDFGNGSVGGLTLFADDYSNRVTLQGTEAGRENILKGIDLINANSQGGASGLAGALRHAVGKLPERTEVATNAVILVDAGAILFSNGPKLSELQDSCQIAKDNNVLRIVVGLPAAGNRLQGWCSDWMYVVRDPNGKDLVGPGGIFDQISARLIRGAKADGAEYSDRLNGFFFDYVPGSGKVDGRVVDPAVISGNELSWTLNTDPPPGGRLIEYKVKAYDDSIEGKQNLSMQAQLTMLFPGGLTPGLAAPNFEMCVYTTARPNFCDSHSLMLTATAMAPTAGTPPTITPTVPATESPTATETPTATDTPTPTTPAPVDTPRPTEPPSATPTDVGPEGLIYLPLVMRAHSFQAQ